MIASTNFGLILLLLTAVFQKTSLAELVQMLMPKDSILGYGTFRRGLWWDKVFY